MFSVNVPLPLLMMEAITLVRLSTELLLTTWFRLLVLPRKLPCGANWATTTFVPGGSEAVLAAAMPAARAFVARGTPLVKKTTLPVGVPAEEVTAAVKVTLDPTADGFWEEASATLELAALT